MSEMTKTLGRESPAIRGLKSNQTGTINEIYTKYDVFTHTGEKLTCINGSKPNLGRITRQQVQVVLPSG